MSEEISSPGPWFPLYVGDYLRDTMHLTTQEHGAYLLLLMAYWARAEPLPDNDRRLAATSKLQASEWLEARPVLEPFFEVADGLWRHGRLDEEIAQAIDRRNKQHNRAKAGAAARHATSSATSSACSKHKEGSKQSSPPPPVKKEPPNGGSKEKRATRLPNDWTLPPDWSEWALQEGYAAEAVARQAAIFHDYWIAKAGSGGCKLNWFATWRNWMRKTPKGGTYDQTQTQSGPGPRRTAPSAIDRVREANRGPEPGPSGPRVVDGERVE